MNAKKILILVGTILVTLIGFATPSWASWATLRASSGSTINVRSEPTIYSSTPSYGLPGDRVEILQCVANTDTPGSDLNWCQVRFPASGAVGWVRSDFIIFEDGGE